jgi:pilus assembly protein CpaE
MIRCIVISPDFKLRQALTNGLQATNGVALLRTLDHYPHGSEAGRLIDSLRPEAVFLDASEPQEVHDTVRRLEALAPGIALIGVDWTATAASLLDAMHAGLRDFIAAPFTQARLAEALDRVAEMGVTRSSIPDPAHQVYSFIPAKAGAGASTLATNTAIALAARNGGDTLLMDLDHTNGVIGFSLNLHAEPPEESSSHEPTAESIWRSMILRHAQLDVLPNAPLPNAPETVHDGSQLAHQSRHLLRMARKKYRTSVVDLAGDYNDDAYSILRQSQMVFLVTTPELPSLRLAHERIAQLTAENLGDRVELIVNRAGSIKREQIEDLLGYPVYFEFENNYQAVNAALQHGVPVGAMAQQFNRFAATISGDPAGREEPPSQWSELLNGLTRGLNRRAA